eukprot:scaffold167801_cov14-Tisochrysis_lutea.AAC.1
MEHPSADLRGEAQERHTQAHTQINPPALLFRRSALSDASWRQTSRAAGFQSRTAGLQSRAQGFQSRSEESRPEVCGLCAIRADPWAFKAGSRAFRTDL